jgi:outer membrane lipoprotein
MTRRFPLYVLSLLFACFLGGCAHVISKDLREQVDPTITFGQVFANPTAYKGKLVLWGGEIIQTMSQKDGTTTIEVFQTPLGWGEEPRGTKGSVVSEGRFLVHSQKHLDPYLYRTGRKITVVGEVQGEETKTLDEMSYRYPVISCKQMYLWEEYSSEHPTHSSYYYDPWWNYPYYVAPHVHHHHKD